MTETENALMFDEGIVPAGHHLTEQLMNLDLKKAYDFMIKQIPRHPDISILFLKQLSSLVMRNTGNVYHTALGTFDASAGELRLVNVSAGRGGNSYLNYQKIPERLDDFCTWINTERREQLDSAASVYELSFEAHYRLVSIHPWVDGNGRMCRLLMNMIQMEKGLLPSILRKEHKAGYIDSLAVSREEKDSKKFIEFMMRSTTEYIAQCIDDFQEACSMDK